MLPQYPSDCSTDIVVILNSSLFLVNIILIGLTLKNLSL